MTNEARSRAQEILDQIAELEASERALPLSQTIQRSRPPFEEQIAIGDARTRWWMAGVIALLFVIANAYTGWLLVHLAVLDQQNIQLHLMASEGRVVTPAVIMALLGATTVQLGSIAVIMARSIFRSRG